MHIVWDKHSSVEVCEHIKLFPYRLVDRQRDGNPEYKEEMNVYCLECNRTYQVIVEVS